MVSDANVLWEPYIQRAPAREFEEGCHFCNEEVNQERDQREMLLKIEAELADLTFCNYHEGILLQRLLSNYVRRKRRKKGKRTKRSGGFIEDIPKADLCDMCGDFVAQEVSDEETDAKALSEDERFAMAEQEVEDIEDES